MPKQMLVDGNSIINRAFYAIPLLTDGKGRYTNAVYGFLNIVLKLYDEEKPDALVVAFDLPKPTHRHLKFEEYKGTRKSMPDELRPQIPLLKEVLAKMNVPVCELEGYEADDLLGTLAVRGQAEGAEVVVVSGDRDLLQIASDRIIIRIPKTKGGQTLVEDYRAADVKAVYGVTPTEYIDVKALMGDASDNIPGVPGIGEKTALKIIQAYGSLEGALQHAEEVKPKKAAENLQTYREQAILSKELATIVTDAPFVFDPRPYQGQEIYTEDAYSFMQELGFRSLLGRFSGAAKKGAQAAAKPEAAAYACITDEAALSVLVSALQKEEKAALEFVCRPGAGEFYGVSITAQEIKPTFIRAGNNLDKETLLWLLLPFITGPVQKLMLDSKKQRTFWAEAAPQSPIENVVFDAMLCGYLLNASGETYAYDEIARVYLNKHYPTAEEIFGKGKKAGESVAEDDLLTYACRQSETVWLAHDAMRKALADNGQTDLYDEIEFPLAQVLFDMEQAGIRVQKTELEAFGRLLNQKIEALTGAVYEIAGEEFKINSPQQLGSILFEKLMLRSGKKTKQGYSTAADVLEKIKGEHPIVPLVLEYRTHTKLKSTYVEGLLPLIRKDGKIHTTFAQTVASTGRISSVEPNLQNIPVRLALGRELRKVFVPTEGCLFVDGDYSQIELRVLAHMAGDEVLIRAFNEGQDIHRLTASQVFHTPYDEVTAAQRGAAKAVNFGLVYGISAYSLSQDIGVSVKEAERYMEGYFHTYPKIKAYLDGAIQSAAEKGYAETVFCRRRPIPELAAQNFVTRGFGERIAMNMPIQGTAADIIKIAMIRVHKRLKAGGLSAKLILQVHDELLLDVPKAEVETVKALLQEEMENAVSFTVKMETEVHQGANWYESK